MKGEFFILGVFLFIFGMIILELIYRVYRRTKGSPVPYTRVKKTCEPSAESHGSAADFYKGASENWSDY